MTAPDATALLGLMPLAGTLGIRIHSATPDEVTGSIEWAAELCTAAGVLHGGVLVSLADSMAGICAYLNLPEGASTSTIELKINFFSAVREGSVLATARPLHRGRTLTVVQTDLVQTDLAQPRSGAPAAGADRLVGQVTQTQAVLQPRGR